MAEEKNTTISRNKKAFHEYQILERLEAGIVLLGTEVKSIRERHAVFTDSFAFIRNNEIYLEGLHLAPYQPAGQFGHEPARARKLLLHKQEIRRLAAKSQEKGFTIVPLSLYFKGRKAKIELGVGKGKKLYDKRETVREREAKRSLDRMKKGDRS